MAGFSSFDDMLNEMTTNGKTFISEWNKNMLPTTAAVAGEASFLARGAGNPAADAIFNTGTNLLFQPVYDTTTNAGAIPHGGNVAPDYKVLLEGSAFTAATTVAPCIMYLVDLVGFYRLTSVTTITAQSTTNTLMNFATITASATNVLTLTSTGSNIAQNLLPYTRVQFTTSGVLPTGISAATNYYIIKLTDTTFSLATSYANAVAGTAISITSGSGSGTNTLQTLLPRYTNGAGLQSFMWNTNATPMGAATPNLSLGYTNSAQAASRATPTVLPIGKTAAANGLILYSGTGVGKYQPFMPLQAGDAGIAQVDTITCATSYVSGEFSVGICKPLARFNITTLGVACERDFVNQLPSCPRIYDGAALYWVMVHGAATPVNSAIMGHFTTAWG